MTRNMFKIFGSIRVACVAGVGFPFIIATSAIAQNVGAPPTSPGAGAPAAAGAGAAAGQAAGPGAQAEAERVIVTGSNIPTAEEVGPNPVLNLNRDLISKSGERNFEQLLHDQPITNGNSITSQNNGTSQEGPDGAASVSLRGFDVSATLVLIDGRRVASYPVTSNGNSAFVDLNTIPLAAIQSIEILKDGASATYGADAVAGVVNIKFWKDYRGAQVTMDYGNTLDKDAGLYSGDVLFGTGDDKVSITGDIFFYHHNSMFNRDRGNSAIPPFLSTNTIPWNFNLSTAVVVAAGGTVAPKVTKPTEFGGPPNGTNGLTPPSQWLYNKSFVRGPSVLGTLLPGFNFNQFSENFPETERWGGYTAFSDKICDDQLVFYGDFYYDETKVHDELAPLATNGFQTPSQFTIFVPPHAALPLDPSGNQISPPNTPSALAVGQPVGAFNPFNPFQQIISGGSRARLLDFGNRKNDIDNHAWEVTLGFKGDKLFDGSWGYDAGFRYSQVQNQFHFIGIKGPAFEQVLNANSSIFDPTSADFIGTTVPYNPFGSGSIATNVPLVKFARAHTRDENTSKLTSFDMNIYTTDLFDLPAGGVGLAIGAGWRREVSIADPDDQDRFPVQALGVSFITPFDIGRKDYDFYAETLIPLFSPQMGIWGLHNVEFSAAGRFEYFRNNDSNVLVPKVTLRWQPFDEQLTIRSTWGEGFLEPSLPQLYGGSAFALAPTNFNGHISAETTTQFTANPNLQPEDSRNWTGGIVYTPKWVGNMLPGNSLTLSVDFWDIERTGVVVTPTAQEVVGRFLSGTLLPGEQVQLDPTGSIVDFVKSFYQNAGRQNARGVDLGLQWQYQTPNWGTFSWLTQATYLDSFIFQSSRLARGREVSGRTNSDPFVGSFLGNDTIGDGWYKWKGTSRIDWTWRNFDLNWSVHYLDGFKEILGYVHDANGNPQAHEHFVHGTWFFDCQASYTLIFTPPVESQPVAGYSKGGKQVMTNKEGKAIESTAAYSMPCWKTVLNNSTFTVGVNDVFGQDPPKAFGFGESNATNYPAFSYDNLGRFVYGEIKKKF